MLLPKTPNERTSETFPSTHSGEYCFFEWHNRCNSGKEQCRDSRAAACSQPIRARRTAGLPVPHGASFHQEPRRGLRGEPPRVLHHGDAQSGEAIRGRENMRRFQEAYPGDAPSLRLRRVLVREGLWVVSLYLQVKRSSSKRLDTGIEGQ